MCVCARSLSHRRWFLGIVVNVCVCLCVSFLCALSVTAPDQQIYLYFYFGHVQLCPVVATQHIYVQVYAIVLHARSSVIVFWLVDVYRLL